MDTKIYNKIVLEIRKEFKWTLSEQSNMVQSICLLTYFKARI